MDVENVFILFIQGVSVFFLLCLMCLLRKSILKKDKYLFAWFICMIYQTAGEVTSEFVASLCMYTTQLRFFFFVASLTFLRWNVSNTLRLSSTIMWGSVILDGFKVLLYVFLLISETLSSQSAVDHVWHMCFNGFWFRDITIIIFILIIVEAVALFVWQRHSMKNEGASSKYRFWIAWYTFFAMIVTPLIFFMGIIISAFAHPLKMSTFWNLPIAANGSIVFIIQVVALRKTSHYTKPRDNGRVDEEIEPYSVLLEQETIVDLISAPNGNGMVFDSNNPQRNAAGVL